jgi:hypothetical protein
MYLSSEVYGDIDWTPALRRDVYQIYRSSRHLLEMIDDILVLGGDMPCFDHPRGGAGVNHVLCESQALTLAPLVNLKSLTLPGVCGAPCRVLVEETPVYTKQSEEESL